MNNKHVGARYLILRTSVLTAALVPNPAMAADPLDQGWDDATQTEWYTTNQGSRIMPMSWMLALKQAGADKAFLDEPHVRSFGYEPYPGSPLPRGFVVDRQDDSDFEQTHLRWKIGQANNEPWVGMTCAACHTGRITFKGKSYQIHGGPTLADFQRFFERLREALGAAAENKFDRFAIAVLGKDDNPANRDMLKKALASLNDFMQQSAALNQTDLQYGPGRLDAVGRILNKIAQVNGAARTDQKKNPSNAPVSYPFLWNIPQHDRVQWNGMAENFQVPKKGLDVGAMGRNVGQVIGVFGDLRIREGAFSSSAVLENLSILESKLRSLRPPRWPAPVDQVLKQRGKVLYDGHCARCHAVLSSRKDLDTPIKAVMVKIASQDRLGTTAFDMYKDRIGSDPWMACNAVRFKSDAGKMAGMAKLGSGSPLLENDRLYEMLRVAASGVIKDQPGKMALLIVAGFFDMDLGPTPAADIFLSEKEKCYTMNSRVVAYKARPLNGIWAAAPYLHNGSVPTLYDLLLPVKDRPKKFYTGTTDFNAEKVGFKTEQGPGNQFPFDTSEEGNSNSGHVYGADSLTEPDRKALVEYLKSL